MLLSIEILLKLQLSMPLNLLLVISFTSSQAWKSQLIALWLRDKMCRLLKENSPESLIIWIRLLWLNRIMENLLAAQWWQSHFAAKDLVRHLCLLLVLELWLESSQKRLRSQQSKHFFKRSSLLLQIKLVMLAVLLLYWHLLHKSLDYFLKWMVTFHVVAQTSQVAK